MAVIYLQRRVAGFAGETKIAVQYYDDAFIHVLTVTSKGGNYLDLSNPFIGLWLRSPNKECHKSPWCR